MIARLQKSMRGKDQGFTLVELLVVIVIIGILAAIAIPLFLGQREKAQEAAMKSDLKNAATLMETYFVDKQTYVVGSSDTDPLTALKASDGVEVGVVSADATAFCLMAGKAPEGSAALTGVFYYDSDNGGLLEKGTTCT